jgi:hypothetical protein
MTERQYGGKYKLRCYRRDGLGTIKRFLWELEKHDSATEIELAVAALHSGDDRSAVLPVYLLKPFAR